MTDKQFCAFQRLQKRSLQNALSAPSAEQKNTIISDLIDTIDKSI